MLDTILTAFLLGLFAGAVPGPYTTVVASTALERGFRPAMVFALIPLVTEIPPMLVTVIFLQSVNYDILTAVGIVGGLAIAYIGVRMFRRQSSGFSGDPSRERRRTFQAMALGGLMSPAPWIFWLVAAGPLFLRSWNRSHTQGVIFAAVLLTMFISTAMGIAWLASHGRRVITENRRRKILRGVGVILVAAGGVLLWQSIEGNFQAMIKRQEALRERVGQMQDARRGVPPSVPDDTAAAPSDSAGAATDTMALQPPGDG